MTRVRLDYAATTPARPEAVAAMEPVLSEVFGNPSGAHRDARAAKAVLEASRERIADLLGTAPGEIVLTGSGTEADNLAVKGAARDARARDRGDGVVVTAIEHKAVLASADRLEREGFRVTRVGAGRDGIVELDALADALDDRTVVVSVMLVNNEVGTIQPLDEVAEIVRVNAPEAVLHTDAVQAVPWLDVAKSAAAADLVTISAHKFGGPKGVGALVVRDGVELEPLVEGGGQEAGRRSGTTNVAGVAGMAAALDATVATRGETTARVGALRDRLRSGVLDALPDAFENGARARTIAGNLHLGFPGVDAELLLVALDQLGVEAASGSSCSSGATEPSHVLRAMGISDAQAAASIRLSLGFPSTDADVDAALAAIPQAVEQLRTAALAS